MTRTRTYPACDCCGKPNHRQPDDPDTVCVACRAREELAKGAIPRLRERDIPKSLDLTLPDELRRRKILAREHTAALSIQLPQRIGAKAMEVAHKKSHEIFKALGREREDGPLGVLVDAILAWGVQVKRRREPDGSRTYRIVVGPSEGDED